METKIKHLEFIQAAINRMANNSFLLKGWSVTIVGGLLAFSFKELNYSYTFISLAILFFFWLLDSYYLSRERLYIKLYNHVRTMKGAETDFSMNTRELGENGGWLGCAFSKTIALFYGGLLVVHIVVIYIL